MQGRLPLSLLACLAAASLVMASSGDRSLEFTSCLQTCKISECEAQHPPTLSFPLRLTRWTCADNCKYWCMHDITSREIVQGAYVQQYYGKWPFWRFLGMQEPASVMFSMFNLWSHVQGALKVRRLVPNSHPMKYYCLVWAGVSINAWVWSSVFHTRDLPLTEKLDYFSAALAILYALYYTVIRLFHLYPTGRVRLTSNSLNTPSNTTRRLWAMLCIVMYIGHVSYLSLLPRFDYTYNVAFNLILGVLHNLLWLMYALPMDILRRFPAVKPSSYRPSFVGKAGVFVALTTAATGLELFDFPPWGRVIDAHALWHLSTAPIALYWYDFLVDDALDSSWRESRA